MKFRFYSVFRVEFEDGKREFRQLSPEGTSWKLGLGDARRVPFMLPDLLVAIREGEPVYIAEGEKDVLALTKKGVPATCNPMGAGGEMTPYAKYLDGASTVRIIADRDEPGRKHAKAWADALAGRVGRIERLEAVKGKDAHDALVTHGLELEEAFGEVKSDDQDEASEPFRPYKLRRFADIQPNLTNRDIIKAVIERESIAVMYGPSGSTESFVATEMGLAIASGQPWRGHRSRRGRVVYIAAEGARGTSKRLEGARRRLALGPAESVQFDLIADVVRLVEGAEDVERFVRTIRESPGEGVVLVIIDTLSQSMAGADENGPKDMTAAIALAQQIRNDLGAAVLIVHRSGKDVAKGARGHSSLRAATDTELEVSQDADGLCRVKATKHKEGETGAVWMHRLESVDLDLDEDGDPVTTAIVKPIGADEAASIETARRASNGKANKLTTDVVSACLDLHRTGQAKPVPRNVLSESGYLNFVAEQGWDVGVMVRGCDRTRLREFLIQRFEGGDEGGRNVDENKNGASTTSDKRRKRYDAARKNADRRIRKGIDDSAICAHGEWIWLREPDREGVDEGGRNLDKKPADQG